MARFALLPWFLAVTLLGAGCVPSPSAVTGTKRPPKVSEPADKRELTEPVVTPAKAFTGTVIGLDGQPAANVTVRGHLISNNGGGLLSDRGNSIISANGGSLASQRRVLSESGLVTQTDAEGRFKLAHPEGQALNLEAVARSDVKALRFSVPADAEGVTLQLAPTGAITGKVTAPDAPGVTNFQGVDVYIPGTGYLAKTTTTGAYTIPDVPVGAFTLVAEKTGLGSGQLKDVAVESKKTTSAADLALAVTVPAIASVSPAHAAPGVEVTLKGEHFGLSSGAPIEVRIGGVEASKVERIDDQTIKATVPGSAGSDGIVVKVNQIASPVEPFKVLESLALTPDTRYLITGAEQQFTVSAKDTDGEAVANPLVTWSAKGAAATVTDGLVKAEAVGTASIEVIAGPSLKKTLPLTVVGSAAGLPANEDLTSSQGLALSPSGLFLLGYENMFKLNPADGSTTVHIGPRAADPAIQHNFEGTMGLVADASGNFYAASGDSILKIAADKTVSTFATGFNYLMDLAIAPDGNLYGIEEDGLHKISPAGVVSTVPGEYSLMGFERVVVAPDGTVYLTSYTEISKVTESGPVPLEDDQQQPIAFDEISDLAVAPNGDLYVAATSWNSGNTSIRRIVPSTGVVSSPTLTPTVSLGYLGGMTFDADGKLLIVDAEKGKFYHLTVQSPTL